MTETAHTDRTGIVLSIVPKRGRAPGFVRIKTGEREQDYSTFEPDLVKQAASCVGKEVTYDYAVKPGKKEGQVYYTLTRILCLPPQTEPSKELARGDAAWTPTTAVLVPVAAPARADLVPGGPSAEQLELGFSLAVKRYQLLQDFIRSHFVEGTHYADGKMFGSAKPVLLQSGAHLIGHAYGYALDPQIVSGPAAAPENPDALYTLVLRCTATSAGGRIMGAAYGACSSKIWSNKQGRYVSRAVDPDKTFNSTLKIGVKRAVVAAIRQSTDAASLFTEDLEEPGYIVDPDSNARKDSRQRQGGYGNPASSTPAKKARFIRPRT